MCRSWPIFWKVVIIKPEPAALLFSPYFGNHHYDSCKIHSSLDKIMKKYYPFYLHLVWRNTWNLSMYLHLSKIFFFQAVEAETAHVIEKMTSDLQIYCRNKPLLQSTPHIGKVNIVLTQISVIKSSIENFCLYNKKHLRNHRKLVFYRIMHHDSDLIKCWCCDWEILLSNHPWIKPNMWGKIID